MNKRISKKHLTEDEKLVLKLYRQCELATFTKFFEENISDAAAFTDQLGKSTQSSGDTSTWTQSEEKKIRATAFLK